MEMDEDAVKFLQSLLPRCVRCFRKQTDVNSCSGAHGFVQRKFFEGEALEL